MVFDLVPGTGHFFLPIVHPSLVLTRAFFLPGFLACQSVLQLFLQDLRFAMSDGCIECVSVAYDAFPCMTWQLFCASFSESDATRRAFETAKKIKASMAQPCQPFKTRGSVDGLSSAVLQLEKPYAAVTETEFLETFRPGLSVSKFKV